MWVDINVALLTVERCYSEIRQKIHRNFVREVLLFNGNVLTYEVF